ncbi:MAG: GNAT family N-acetyltransferase, partial [Deltaproteobacteria bacterium]|nr:GNAT family N-acetyltransferase [Deltaproteobacteria bacterium]
AGFDCGVKELNEFLNNLARQNLKKGLSRTFVLIKKSVPEEILGYYTLSVFEITAEKLPHKFAKKYKGHLPAVKIARLAVAKALQNQGLGKHLIINAIKRVITISENAGVVGLFVDAKNENVRKYYSNFGFIALPDHPLELFLPLNTLLQMRSSIFNKSNK